MRRLPPDLSFVEPHDRSGGNTRPPPSVAQSRAWLWGRVVPPVNGVASPRHSRTKRANVRLRVRRRVVRTRPAPSANLSPRGRANRRKRDNKVQKHTHENAKEMHQNQYKYQRWCEFHSRRVHTDRHATKGYRTKTERHSLRQLHHGTLRSPRYSCLRSRAHRAPARGENSYRWDSNKYAHERHPGK